MTQVVIPITSPPNEASGAFADLPPTPPPAISGLNVPQSPLDANARANATAALVEQDIQGWRSDTETWENGYLTTRRMADAVNAEEDSRLFHEARFNALREKYANNPEALKLLQEGGDRIVSRSVGLMRAHAREESGKFRADVLGKDEAAVRELFASPHSSAEERGEAYLGYLRKAEAFRTSNGATPEQNAAWRKAFSASLADDTMRTKYERLVQENPDVALRILNMALGDGKPSDSAPGAGPGSGSAVGPGPGYDLAVPASEPAPAGYEPETVSTDSSVDPQAEREGQLAAEYAKSFTPERLRSLKNQAEIGVDKARRETDERVSMVYAKTGSAMLQAMESGDVKTLQGLEDDLRTLGKTDDAQQMASMRKLVELVQPHLASGRFDSFDQQKAAIEKLFSGSLMQGMGNGTGQMGADPMSADPMRADRALDLARRSANALIDKWQDQYRRDPAGYVLGHPQLGEEGMSTEEFCTRKGLTLEQHISSSLRMQERMEKSIGAPSSGISPRVLPEARAAQIKDGFAALTDPREQAAFVRTLSKDSGKYAQRVMAEAGLPPGMTAFVEVMPGLAESEAAKLAQASGTSLEAMNLPPERMASIRQHVGNSPMARWLLFADRNLSGSGNAGPGATGPGNMGREAAEVIHSLESFVALGGNLANLERRMELANTWLARDIAARTATQMAMHKGDQVPHQTPGQANNAALNAQLAAANGDAPVSDKAPSGPVTYLDERVAADTGRGVGEPIAKAVSITQTRDQYATQMAMHKGDQVPHQTPGQANNAALNADIAAATGDVPLASSKASAKATSGEASAKATSGEAPGKPAPGEVAPGEAPDKPAPDKAVADKSQANGSPAAEPAAKAAAKPSAASKADPVAYAAAQEFGQDEPIKAPQSTEPWQDAMKKEAHALGVGGRAVVDAFSSTVDTVYDPIRFIGNTVMGWLGGDPEYLKAVGTRLSDGLGLPMPETDLEKASYALIKGGTEAAFMVWGAGLLATYKGTNMVSKFVVQGLKAYRADAPAEIASSALAAAGEQVAQQADLGTVGTMAVSLGLGMAGSTGASVVSAVERKAAKVTKYADMPHGFEASTAVQRKNWLSNVEKHADRVDENGFIDIAGTKVPFGKKNADGQWEGANELFKHTSVEELTETIVRGREKADGLFAKYFRVDESGNVVAHTAASSSGKLPQVATGISVNGKAATKNANGTLGHDELGEAAEFFNQDLVPHAQRRKGDVRYSEDIQKVAQTTYADGTPVTTNTTWDNLHAEMHALQQAIEDKLIKAGDTVELAVTGKKEVCVNCRAQLAKVAEKLKLRTMTVVDHKKGITYYWREGMTELLPLDELPKLQTVK